MRKAAFVSLYLWVWLVVLIAGVVLSSRPSLALHLALWGGLGGTSHAWYRWERHRKYGPDEVFWSGEYYLSPILGLLFGAGLFAGLSLLLVFSSFQIRGGLSVLLAGLAWVIGFFQNKVIRAINTILSGMYPSASDRTDIGDSPDSPAPDAEPHPAREPTDHPRGSSG